jgi:imidazole glycerol phosphate synthase glutamine amidotransferase subunit
MPVALVDYGAGNLSSVRKALAAIGADVFVPVTPDDLRSCDGIIVPGVGHFGATRALHAGWRSVISTAVAAGRPVLGICLGLQWLFEGSDEAPDVPGLALLEGRSVHLTDARLQRQQAGPPPPMKVPHVGWNAVSPRRASWILSGIPSGTGADVQMYFTHSYAVPAGGDTAATTSVAATTFSSVVERGNVAGVQFHPEKSSDSGVTVLKNFLARCHGRDPGVQTIRPPDRAAASPSKRIIACLDVRNGCVVKGVHFEDLRIAGDPAELARRYNIEGIDEIVILDITATIERRRALADTIHRVARELFIPLAVGGGIRTEADAAAAVEAGADKVSLNTAALADPALITTLAARYGSQAVVVAIDAKRDADSYAVYARSGHAPTGRDAVSWAREAEQRGAGEILLTSIDRDGTKAGFDCALTAAVASAVSIPVIASGGAGSLDDFVDVFTTGRADAALAATIFHDAETGVQALKQHLRERRIPVR